MASYDDIKSKNGAWMRADDWYQNERIVVHQGVPHHFVDYSRYVASGGNINSEIRRGTFKRAPEPVRSFKIPGIKSQRKLLLIQR